MRSSTMVAIVLAAITVMSVLVWPNILGAVAFVDLLVLGNIEKERRYEDRVYEHRRRYGR